MDTPLDIYKSLIDRLVERKYDVYASRLAGESATDMGDVELNDFVAALDVNQRRLLAKMLQKSRSSGMHTVLAYLNDEINLSNLRLVSNGNELPVEPFGTELYYDWVCRCEGDDWPSVTEE